MSYFTTRRLIITLLATIAVIGILIIAWTLDLTLRDGTRFTGWFLMGSILFLAGYNLRKKLPYPPLGNASTWLQIHIYAGYATIAIFLFHTGFRKPNGQFETTLYLIFSAVSVSGLIGLILSRYIPRRLTAHGYEVLFERIPSLRLQLSTEAQELVVDSVRESENTTLANFYKQVLSDFFSRPKNLWLHSLQSTAPRRTLLHKLDSLDRYLNKSDQERSEKLAELISHKDSLDYHYTMQGILKIWLFVHIPLTYILLLFAVIHVVLVHAFAGVV